ncbi:MAG TPA: AraC family transcriptional regulator [Pedobacter sp.]|nr:AraC family transcriptional regulator [Pedobacter sp.]
MEQQSFEVKKRIKEGFLGQRIIVLPPHIKRKLTANPLIRNFYLTAIGHYPKASNHYIERKTGSNQYILIYCTEGRGSIHVNEVRYDLLPNTYFIIPKHVQHTYHSNESNPWSIHWAHFTGEVAERIYERFLNDGAPVVHDIPYDENRIKLFEQIYSIVEHSFQEKEMEIMSVSLLHFVSSMVYYKEANPAIYNKDAISNSILFMKQNINEKFGIEELAQQQNISVSHYSRSFKRKTGVSPINYFNQLKIHKSCQYLYFTDRNIKEIGAELGFDDQYYFSRLFRNVMGMSPSKYKNNHKTKS